MISLNGSDYFEADELDEALLLTIAPSNELYYKVTVNNNSSVELEDMTISDTFVSKTSKIQQTALRSIENATYEDGVFTLDEIEKNGESTFTYRATLNTKADFNSANAYNEVEILDYEIVGSSRYTKQIGQTDQAYVVLPELEEEKTLRKYCNKSIISDGEEVIYTIFFKNEYEYDLKDVVFTDDYDETHIKILSASAEDDSSTLKFKRTIIRPGQSVMFRYTAQGINQEDAAVKARNVVTIFTNTIDLSNESAERTITIYPPNEPLPLLKTGPTHFVLICLALISTLFFKHRRKMA